MAAKDVKTAAKTKLMAGEKARRAKADWLCQRLDAEYGILTWRSHGEPMGALVATILSQHTSDKNSEKAFDALRRRFPDWDAVRTAPVTEIADAIRGGGLADAKAPRIKNVLQAIYDGTGATNLDFLDALPTGEAKAYLRSFPGVGPKTMACVMMFSLGRPVLPVDTHVFRVSHRIGLIDPKIGEAKAHDALESLLKPEQVYPFHVHLIRHGRRVCTARAPLCESCVLREKCDYFRQRSVEAALPSNPVRVAEPSAGGGLGGEIKISRPEQKALLVSLANAEGMIRNEKGRETVVLFGPDGKGITARRYEGSSVPVKDILPKMAGGIVTHNHPSGYSFSYEDIAEVAYPGRLAEIRAVSRQFTYSIMPPGDEWTSQDAKAVTGVHLEEYKARRDALRPLVEADELSEIEANKQLNESLHDIWVAIADKTGLRYNRMEFPRKGR